VSPIPKVSLETFWDHSLAQVNIERGHAVVAIYVGTLMQADLVKAGNCVSLHSEVWISMCGTEIVAALFAQNICFKLKMQM